MKENEKNIHQHPEKKHTVTADQPEQGVPASQEKEKINPQTKKPEIGPDEVSTPEEQEERKREVETPRAQDPQEQSKEKKSSI